MNLDSVFPEYLTNQSPWLFLVHFGFVGSIFLGQYFLCLWIQERKNIFANVLIESFLFVPFFLFPLGFLLSQFGWANVCYGVAQVLFILLAGLGVFQYRRRLRIQTFKEIGTTEWIVYAVIFVLGYFGWLVPIPDNYNGHGHILWNVLTRMLHAGGFDLLDRSSLASDDIIQLFFPPHFTFWLRLYCLDFPLFSYRSALLVSMAVGFLLVQVLKAICQIFRLPKAVGLLGLLGVIGTYFNSLILYEIQYDTFALLLLLYSLYLLARFFVEGKVFLTNMLVLLLFSFLIRTQVFLILFLALLFTMAVSFKKIPRPLVIRPLLLLMGALPLLLWLTVASVKYGHPLWPMSRGLIERAYRAMNPHYQGHPLVALEEVPLKRKVLERAIHGKEGGGGARVQYFSGFLPDYFLGQDWIRGVVLFLIRAGPLALGMTCLFLILWRRQKIASPGKAFFIVSGLLLLGWLVEYILFYFGHNKFPQYLSAITLLPAGIVLYSIQKSYLRSLPLLLVLYLFLNCNVLLFGHRNLDFHFLPSKILLGQMTFMEKLAFKTNKDVLEIQQEVKELNRAYQSGKRILHVEVEPGALLPALVGQEFLGRAFYFSLINYPLRDVITARDKAGFQAALAKKNIGYIAIPQRDHQELEAHPLLLLLRKWKQESRYHLLVPVSEVLEHIQY